MRPKLFLYLFLLCILTITANSQSIGISPTILHFSPSVTRQQLVLFNENPFDVSYDIVIDENSDMFTFQESGLLNAGKSSPIIITLVGNPVSNFDTLIKVSYHLSDESPMSIMPQASSKIIVNVDDKSKILNLNEAVNQDIPKKTNTLFGILITAGIVALGSSLFFFLGKKD